MVGGARAPTVATRRAEGVPRTGEECDTGEQPVEERGPVAGESLGVIHQGVVAGQTEAVVNGVGHPVHVIHAVAIETADLGGGEHLWMIQRAHDEGGHSQQGQGDKRHARRDAPTGSVGGVVHVLGANPRFADWVTSRRRVVVTTRRVYRLCFIVSNGSEKRFSHLQRCTRGLWR